MKYIVELADGELWRFSSLEDVYGHVHNLETDDTGILPSYRIFEILWDDSMVIIDEHLW